jgi:hypothetical protein
MNENYLKMCIAGQEILRKNWTQKAGDRVLTRWNSDENKLEIDYYSNDFVTKRASLLLHKRTDVWLPYQEDLQEIAIEYLRKEDMKNGGNPNGWDNLFLQDAFWHWYREFEDFNFNELWLCFFMETRYHKTWNGETWEVIE